MVFSSVIFLYCFLGAAIILYYAAPKKLRNAVLLLSSLAFYFVGGQMLVFLMLGVVMLGYAAGIVIAALSSKKTAARLTLAAVLIIDFGLLVYFKYMGFFLESINGIFGMGIKIPDIVLPIGISFYIFQAASYVIDVYRGTVAAQKNPVTLAVYVTMFPQLIAGPIVRYTDIADMLCGRRESFADFSCGVRRFCFGLAKKVLIANNFAELIKIIGYSDEKSVLFSWMSALAFTFNIYFDFSGYSDMAIGLGRMFGFRFPENFNYPYISRSITEFWHRWHITLGTWFRDYVYIPLGGNRHGLARQILNILIVWLLTGIWHGAGWTFALWGLMYAVLLIAEKLVGKLCHIPRAVGVIYTLFFTVIGFSLFGADNLGDALSGIGGMFGIGVPTLCGDVSLYYLRSYAVLFLVSAVASTPLAKYAVSRLEGTRTGKVIITFAEPYVCALFLLVSTGYLIDGSFNPFLYFRF